MVHACSPSYLGGRLSQNCLNPGDRLRWAEIAPLHPRLAGQQEQDPVSKKERKKERKKHKKKSFVNFFRHMTMRTHCDFGEILSEWRVLTLMAQVEMQAPSLVCGLGRGLGSLWTWVSSFVQWDTFGFYLIRLTWGLSEMTNIQCVAQCKYSQHLNCCSCCCCLQKD